MLMLYLGVEDSVPLILGPIPSVWMQEPFWWNSNSVQESAGIVLIIWQVLGTKLIPLEFQEFPRFCRIPAGINGGQ